VQGKDPDSSEKSEERHEQNYSQNSFLLAFEQRLAERRRIFSDLLKEIRHLSQASQAGQLLRLPRFLIFSGHSLVN
jgi:hypothetical protein